MVGADAPIVDNARGSENGLSAEQRRALVARCRPAFGRRLSEWASIAQDPTEPGPQQGRKIDAAKPECKLWKSVQHGTGEHEEWQVEEHRDISPDVAMP